MSVSDTNYLMHRLTYQSCVISIPIPYSHYNYPVAQRTPLADLAWPFKSHTENLSKH